MKTFTDAAGRTWTIALNLGTAMAVKDKLGVDLLQPEDGDPPVLTADASKAREELGWAPAFGDLETIVESAWKFHTAHPNGYGDR